MKKLACITVLLFSAAVLYAWRPSFSYAVEWGYTATVLKSCQRNFICSEGYRIIENPNYLYYYSNGSVLVSAGLNLFDHLNLSVSSGLLGVYSRRWMVPVDFRVKWCPNGLFSDGFLVQAAAGPAFPTSALYETGMRGLAGVGYRVAFVRKLSLDFMVSWNITMDHENIIDPDTRTYVSRSNITSNITEYQAINFSVALNF